MNTNRRSRRTAPIPSGFTLVELTLTSVLIAVLAAVAVARLGDARDHTLGTRMHSLAGALQTAVSNFHANWQLQGRPHLDVPGWADGSIDANGYGFPVSGNHDAVAVASDEDCADIWRALLDHGPRVAAAEPEDDPQTPFAERADAWLAGADFLAGQDTAITDATVTLSATPAAEICQFVWLPDRTPRPGAPKRTIFYDSRTGQVFTDLNRIFG